MMIAGREQVAAQRCSAKNAHGKPCGMHAMTVSGRCSFHDPTGERVKSELPPSAPRCTAKNADLQPCRARWVLASGFCPHHDPETKARYEAEQAATLAKIAAMRRESAELKARQEEERKASARLRLVKRLLRIAERILEDETDRGGKNA